MHVEDRHYQSDIRLTFFVGFLDVPSIEDRQPGAKHDEAGGERDEVRWIEQ